MTRCASFCARPAVRMVAGFCTARSGRVTRPQTVHCQRVCLVALHPWGQAVGAAANSRLPGRARRAGASSVSWCCDPSCPHGHQSAQHLGFRRFLVDSASTGPLTTPDCSPPPRYGDLAPLEFRPVVRLGRSGAQVAAATRTFEEQGGQPFCISSLPGRLSGRVAVQKARWRNSLRPGVALSTQVGARSYRNLEWPCWLRVCGVGANAHCSQTATAVMPRPSNKGDSE